ncbi:MAG TPA: DUF481 domain-containing protein [Sulfurimonas autotrophica]|nr:DUF481 domain-containing protein [Sulfurimonas autotrophica]
MKLLAILFFYVLSAEALITIAPVDIGAKPGLSGGIKGSFTTKRGNTQSDGYSAGARVQYDNNISYVAWGDLSASYAKASGVTNTNKTFAHIRYIHTLLLPKKSLNWETFIQSQTDKFTKIQNRLLVGIGLRYHTDLQEYGDVYFGIGAFAEHIKYTTDVDPNEENVRLNIYIAYKNRLMDNVRFSYVGYYQPRVDILSDAIFANSAEIRVKIYKKLSINFELLYNHDTKPAVGIEKYDFSQKTSFVYDF